MTEGEFVVVGVEPNPGGALFALLARDTAGELIYAGAAFVTLPQPARDQFWTRTEAIKIPKAAVPELRNRKASFVRPELRVHARHLRARTCCGMRRSRRCSEESCCIAGMVPHVNELILEFLAEMVGDFATLREMNDDELGRLFREWLQRRHPERYPTLQLPLKSHARFRALAARCHHRQVDRSRPAGRAPLP